MQRVLSFQMTRGTSESSEYVTKRLCFSSLFSVSFLCLLSGFMLGRFATERSMEAQAQKRRAELAGNGLQNTEHFQQLALQELERASFNHNHAINWQMPDSLESNMQRINELFSNLSFIHEVTNHTSCVRATVRGLQEPDRYIILSVNGDSVTIALALAQILDKIYSTHNWRPRRSLIFCVSLVSLDICPQTLPAFMTPKVVAYVAMHGPFLQVDGDIVLSGSDIIRSIAVEAIKTIPGDNNWTYLEYEIFGPRLLLDMPQVIFSYHESNLAFNQTHHNKSERLRSITLAQMVSQTVWRLSDSIVIQWEPKYFNETVNKMLKSINSNKFQDAKEKLQKTLTTLLDAIKDLNMKIDATENIQALRVRIWNDLLLDLDKTLLCSDENAHSRTDPAMFHKLSLQSTSNLLSYLDEMTKCYENAIQVLQER